MSREIESYNEDSQVDVIPPANTTDVISMKAKNTVGYWKEIAQYWKQQFDISEHDRLLKHQELIAVEGMFDEYKNEFNGLLRREREVAKLALQELLSDYAAHLDIQDVVKERQGKFNFKVTIPLVIMVLGILTIWQLASNPEFRVFVNQNAFALIVGVLGVVFIVFVIAKQKVSKK